MTARFEQDDIRFLYPENWALTAGSPETLPREVSVQSPGGGFWTLQLHPASVEPSELLETVVSILSKEYDSFESERATELLGGINSDVCLMNFFCLDMLVAAKAMAFATAGHTVLVLCQAENREFDALQMVFQAISTSLVQQSFAQNRT